MHNQDTMATAKKFLAPAGWRAKNNALFRFLSVALAFFVLLFLLNIFTPQIKFFFNLVSGPIHEKLWAAGKSSSDFSKSFLNANSLANENENLRAENQNLLSQINYLQATMGSIEAWDDISEFNPDNKFNLVMAGVIGYGGQGVITISKGSDSGIEKGMPVISQQMVLFGKITEVYKGFSKVMLITSQESVVNVKVANGIYGVIKGSGGLSGFLDLVPIDEVIKEGDVLITSSLEETFPKDLLIGKITKVIKNDQSPHQQAELELFLSLGTDNLFVITNYKQ